MSGWVLRAGMRVLLNMERRDLPPQICVLLPEQGMLQPLALRVVLVGKVEAQ